jgi:amidohydrolase
MAIETHTALGSLTAVVRHVTAIRHDLHRHPELGYEEHRTAGVVAAELSRLGVEHKTGFAGGTGVVGLIRGEAGDGPCVALRADMDALPIEEQSGLPYASTVAGKMHACGHDGHTAVLLGAAAVLKEMEPRLKGTVKLIFQPAEEGGCGADKFCDDGVLGTAYGPKVDAIFGLHGWPGLKVGTAATRPGPLLASVDGFTITITGRGGHAAAPAAAVDPIVCGAAIVQALQTVISRECDPNEASVLTVSQFHAGSSFNVIPETAELNGTFRALSRARRVQITEALERIARGVAAAHRCGVTFRYYGTTPCTNNTPEMAEFVAEVARKQLGESAFFWVPQPAMWGEDFAFYLDRVPGCFFVLGVQPLDQNEYPMLHHPKYDFTDAAIPHGIRMMAGAAVAFLER